MSAREYLIDLLQRAHAGELAAALAYDGHSKSVSDPVEKAEIAKIRDEELHHRGRLFQMLADLGARPVPWFENRMSFIGRTISFLCHIGGWFMPMYGAGKLERGNIAEYEIAARLAHKSGEEHLVEELLAFAELEWDHEQYFRKKSESHWMVRIFRIWPAPPPRESIRESYARFLVQNDIGQVATAVFSINRLARYRKL